MYLGKLIIGPRRPFVVYTPSDEYWHRSIEVNIFRHWFLFFLPERRLTQPKEEGR